MVRGDGLLVGSSLVEKAKRNMSVSEMREWTKLDNETSRLWRNFWIKILKNQGHSNVEIAREFDISESAVRRVSKDKS